MSKTIYCLLFVLALAGRLKANEGPVEPYVVYVAREGEFARCGPSEEYYKTDPLRAGAEVEVYLETEDGWLGIRPPADSFCWLQSDQVEVADDETLGTVIEPSTVAWIGTHLGKARQYRWQVRLDQGEQVTILGTASREGPEGEEIWYRIVPPPGEFRWVQRTQVSDSRDDVVYGQPSIAPQQNIASQPAPKRAEADRAAAESNDSVLDDAPVGSGLVKLEGDVQIRSIEDPSVTAAVETADHQAGWASGSRVVAASASGPGAAALQPTAPPRLEPLQSAPAPNLGPSGYRPSVDVAGVDLDGLRLELSHAMAAGARALEMEPLRGRAAELTDQIGDSVIRGRASLLLRRIEEYQRMAQQRDGQVVGAVSTAAPTASSPTPTIPAQSRAAAGGAAAAASGIAAASVNAAASDNGQMSTFDGQGWLVRVYSARPNAPPYAITDSAGRTLSYVTPAPGLNLRRYLNQEIGLYGRVAYDTSLETPHLIVEQAVRLRTP